MMQKRKLSSLLLISFIVVFAFSYAAANTVTYEGKTVLRCDQVNQNVTASPSQEIAGFELVFETVGGGVEATGLTVTAGPDMPTGWYFDVDYTQTDGTAPDVVRVIGLRLDPGLGSIAVGDAIVAVLHYETSDVCDGSITFRGAEWIGYPNPVGMIKTQFCDVIANCVDVAVTEGVVVVENADPVLAAIPDDDTHYWGEAFTYTAAATDADLANGCESLTYSLDTPPTGMVIDDATGVITWDPIPGANVCDNVVKVDVEDECSGTSTTSFTICVKNHPPEFTDIPADILIGAGETAYGDFEAVDPDGGPGLLEYTVLDWTGAGTVVMDPADGSFSWDVEMDYGVEDYVFTLTVVVTDGAALCDCAPNNADTASMQIEVVPLRFYIEKAHDVPQGQFYELSLNMPDSTFINHPMGGFEFLIQYDASALTLMEVTAGDFVTNCGWEYFTYRTGPFGNCGNACPSGMIRIVGLAEYNNGAEHPDCWSNNAGFVQIASMKYLVSNDRTLECMFVPVRFIWIDCNDNSVSDKEGDRLFIGRRVFDYVGVNGVDSYVEITDDTQEFPSIFGPEDHCGDWVDTTKPPIYEFIDFFNGGIDIVCAKDIDDRGDINMDGVAYSIADAVMFSNYFIYGLGAFPTGYEDGSVAASDINADGYTLSVADLVYLIRVIVGDANPYDNPFQKPVTTTYTYHNGVVNVTGEMGAAAFVFDGNIDVELLAPNMDLKYEFDGEVTRALVWSQDGEIFSGDVVRGSNMISMELGSADGGTVVTNWLPSEFGLSQNYPNPFNPVTSVPFALPTAQDVNLTVYNVAGQVVSQLGGHFDAGVHEIRVDASTYASGIYFYKLTAGDFTETKKMVLLK